MTFRSTNYIQLQPVYKPKVVHPKHQHEVPQALNSVTHKLVLTFPTGREDPPYKHIDQWKEPKSTHLSWNQTIDSPLQPALHDYKQ
ncbi:hypothetical protein RHMOL_Rhmol03G0012200 [Rhododendron molle]|uniref:Uncharacterized protein n=1 Tax=Rhododendron molle TaxID=49168 RepID=A0ACC0PBQ8_RHOML|nr:hypothetical protein RHMOL_Rhmol03G0012200 [Rhododendron molle]